MTQRAVDHVPIIVSDLAAAFDTYRWLGFNPMPVSHHSGRATANHIICFGSNYTELVGKPDPTVPDPVMDELLKSRQGMALISFRSFNAEADRARLQRQGIAVSDVMNLERPVTIPEFSGIVRFRLALPDSAAHPLVQVFLTEHLTPAAFQISSFLQHANGAKRISGITIVADAPGALLALLEACAGTAAVYADDGSTRIDAADTAIEIITPESVPRRWPGCMAEPKRPYILGLHFRVDRLADTATFFSARKVPFRLQPNGSFVILPDVACGVLQEFSEA